MLVCPKNNKKIVDYSHQSLQVNVKINLKMILRDKTGIIFSYRQCHYHHIIYLTS